MFQLKVQDGDSCLAVDLDIVGSSPWIDLVLFMRDQCLEFGEGIGLGEALLLQ